MTGEKKEETKEFPKKYYRGRKLLSNISKIKI